MALIVDSGAVYALYDADDAHHTAVRHVVEQDPGPLIIPTVILAEIDYLLREFLGVDAELCFFQDVATGAFLLEPLTTTDWARCQELVALYRDLEPGLADTAVFATAERLHIKQVLTVDERDFRAMRSTLGFLILLPADA
ncbi:MAG: PIN domain-containing protein [Candidatus Competibacteraceae bacterium]|nr:PIN domain-containing protein [Candidatus Competibacteraceae bacterium]